MVLAPARAEIGAMLPLKQLTLFMTVTCVSPASNQIRVRLYDYAGVSSKTLNQAKGVAGEVLATAGVEVSWAGCLPGPTAAGDASCRLPVTPSDLHLLIVNEKMAKRTPTSGHCLGYAILSGEFPSIASVFFHRALDLEKGNLVDRSEVLGAMMAHELGHLLLGEHSHPKRGIMRGVWDDQDLKTIAKGRMWFTQEEAARIEAGVARRTDTGLR